jgi:hypothetical protein
MFSVDDCGHQRVNLQVPELLLNRKRGWLEVGANLYVLEKVGEGGGG